jgi:hypothetical protein
MQRLVRRVAMHQEAHRSNAQKPANAGRFRELCCAPGEQMRGDIARSPDGAKNAFAKRAPLLLAHTNPSLQITTNLSAARPA